MKRYSTIRLLVGTRKSALALWQTDWVIERLHAAWPGVACVVQPFLTEGDRTQAQNKPLPEIGGKGLFTQELEEALRNGDIDLAVHSLKDLPVEEPPGVTIGAIPTRADVRDGLVARNGWTLATLPHGSVVGTSSTRRAAQLLAARPDLVIRPIRGNVETRIKKVLNGDYDATVLALAGLNRLNLAHHVTDLLSLEIMLPAPGQGALAIQCRSDDEAVRSLLEPLEDATVRAAVNAERGFLSRLGGGCSAPVAAYATPVDGETRCLSMEALVASPDGQHLVRVCGQGRADELAERLAAEALAQGAADLLVRVPAPVAVKPQPLAGRRIVLTRPEDQSQDLAQQLEQLGAQPLILPVIRIVPRMDLQPLDRAVAELDAFDWIVLTSVNAVTIFGERWRAMNRQSNGDHRWQVAAVGPATADALRTFGIDPALVPAIYRAEEIVAGLGDVAGRRILVPQASAARPALVEQLTAQGAEVTVIPVYDTVPAELSEGALAELAQGVDAVLFTSGSTVRNFVNAVRPHPAAFAQVQKAALICIGPVTAEAVQEAGLPTPVIADEATTASLVQRVRTYFSPKG
jgi:hydroxymethylbilane synthase